MKKAKNNLKTTMMMESSSSSSNTIMARKMIKTANTTHLMVKQSTSRLSP